MAGNESAALAEGHDETTNVQEMDKFKGFAAKDGEVQKPAEPAKDTSRAMQNQPKQTNKVAQQQAEAADGENDDDKGDKGEDKGGKHASADKRIAQAVGRQRAAERRAEAAERRSADMEARLARLEQGGGLTAPANKGNELKEPDPKDYEGGEYDARYLKDVAKYEVAKAVAETTNKVRTETQQAARTERTQAEQEAFQRQRDDFFAAASEKYEDFEDKVGLPVDEGGPPISPTIGTLAMESEVGADILYELADDLKEARKVFGMSPARQAAWFGRREFELSSKSSDADDENGGDGGEDEESRAGQSGSKSKVTKAPPVPEYNSKGRGAVPKVSADTTDFAAFERTAMAKAQPK